MLFTREEIVEMGLLKPEVSDQPAEVASSGLPGCQAVARSKQQVATDLSLYIIYTYFSRLLGCKNIYNLVEINVKGKCENAFSPCNRGNHSLADFLVSTWETYNLERLFGVAKGCQTLQPDNLEKAIRDTQSSNLMELIRADYRFYKRHGHPPGDAWDGIITDDGLDLNQFDPHEARVIPDVEVLAAAMVERQRVKPGRTMLSLMYEHNVNDYVWFEGQDGQWHCYTTKGMQ